MTIRVAICDDQALVRDGLRVQLGYAEDIEVVGEASDGEQAVALARRERPDVLLMDVRMPRLDGIAATRLIRRRPGLRRRAGARPHDVRRRRDRVRRPRGRRQRVPPQGRDARGDRARGPGRRRRRVPPRAVGHVAAGARVRPRPTAGRPRGDLLAALTERETEVLPLVAQGCSNAEIADRLVISPATAKTHVSRVLAKLGARDRAQLVVDRLRGRPGGPRHLTGRTSREVRLRLGEHAQVQSAG